jgi:hypothetical protein
MANKPISAALPLRLSAYFMNAKIKTYLRRPSRSISER